MKLNSIFLCGCIFLLVNAQVIAAEPEICFAELSNTSSQFGVPGPLPSRKGPQTQTTKRVPHKQIDVQPVLAVNAELHRLAFSLPAVDKRPTIVSIAGTDGMWLQNSTTVVRPKAIPAGREFAHIHPDGSLHAPLPYKRALELTAKGWGERHPWADRRDGWEGFVMLFTPQSLEELKTTFQLILESYNYVTGKRLGLVDCKSP